MDNKTDIKNLVNRLDTIQLSESFADIIDDKARQFTDRVSKAEGIKRRALSALKDAVLRLDLLTKNEVEESKIAEVADAALKDIKNAMKIIREIKQI